MEAKNGCKRSSRKRSSSVELVKIVTPEHKGLPIPEPKRKQQPATNSCEKPNKSEVGKDMRACEKHGWKGSKRHECPESKKPLHAFRDYASRQGGKFLRFLQNRAGVKAEYLCHNKHKFARSLSDAAKQKWCPVCEMSVLLNDRSCKEAKALDEKFNVEYRKKQQRLLQEAKLAMLCATCAPPAPRGKRFTDQSFVETSAVSSPILDTSEASLIYKAEKDVQDYSNIGLTIEQSLAVLKIINDAGNPYKVLQVKRSLFEGKSKSLLVGSVKKSYKFLALKVHPDKNPHPKSSEAMNFLNAALKSILSSIL